MNSGSFHVHAIVLPPSTTITCPVIVNIGLQDNVCPPETGYALFDRIGATNKQLYPYDGHGHDGGRSRHGAIVDRFFAEHLLGDR